MIWFTILFTVYLVAIGINACFQLYKDRSYKIWTVAFDMWKDTLNKKGFPRHASGAMMTYWELADYFDNSKEGKEYIKHVKKNWKHEKNRTCILPH